MKRQLNFMPKTTPHFLTLLLLFACFSKNYGQLPKSELGEIIFENVVQQDGLTKEEIYKKAKLWIVTTLKSGDNMVELGGDESTNITGTGNVILSDQNYSGARGYSYEMQNISLNFKFSIFCKDSRYKYRIENFTLRCVVDDAHSIKEYRSSLEEPKIVGLEGDKKKAKRDKIIQSIYEETNSTINKLITNLKGIVNTQEEEW